MTDDIAARSKTKAIIGVLIALGSFAFLSILDVLRLVPSTLPLGLVTKWSIFFLVMVWAFGVERLKFSALSIKRPSFGTFGWGIVAVLTTFLCMGIYYRLVAPMFGHLAMPARAGTLAHAPWYQLLFACLTAGIVEEMVFRFYSITRLYWLTNSKWIASIIPITVHVALHIPGYGWGQVIPVTIGMIVLTGLYWIRRDYWCNAFAHFLIDFSSLAIVAFRAH